jgi:hypothetical protein
MSLMPPNHVFKRRLPFHVTASQSESSGLCHTLATIFRIPPVYDAVPVQCREQYLDNFSKRTFMGGCK